MSEEIFFKPRINIPDDSSFKNLSENEKIKNGICPSCSGRLAFQEGCKVCFACGWGGCS